MKNPILIKFLSFLVHLVICLIGTALVLYAQDGFGSGDTSTLLFWTIPFSAALAVSGATILSLIKTQRPLLRLILVLFTAGLVSYGYVYLVYLLLGPWINAFSLPVFYLWLAGALVQLLFMDKLLPPPAEHLPSRKVILSLLAFPLMVVVTMVGVYIIFLIFSYFTLPEPVTYLIPHDYTGKFRVIYGEVCGIDPPVENGRRILTIPENGVLIVQPEFEAGVIDYIYYSQDDSGRRQELPPVYDHTDPIKGVRLGAYGHLGGVMPDGSFSSESPLAIHYTDLYVSEGSSNGLFDKESIRQVRQIDSLTTILVNSCRAKSGR